MGTKDALGCKVDKLDGRQVSALKTLPRKSPGDASSPSPTRLGVVGVQSRETELCLQGPGLAELQHCESLSTLRTWPSSMSLPGLSGLARWHLPQWEEGAQDSGWQLARRTQAGQREAMSPLIGMWLCSWLLAARGLEGCREEGTSAEKVCDLLKGTWHSHRLFSSSRPQHRRLLTPLGHQSLS